ncbi:MAG: 23S rRNA (uracil(1939)-C(5))-methyltransferase RlmD [Thermodesulfobacteriota bacterium]|nr:23S rRNA (uracil(1939)-C(5))-methyltransferase RlmD [Thermodesulfobacteriota bacterium]
MKDNTLILDIDSLSYGGRGVGRREDGKVIFVPGVLPREKIHARIYKEHSSYTEATLLDVIHPSPDRINPRCKIFASCGGCSWQHISYNEQLKWKQDILAGEIIKTCKTTPEAIYSPVASKEIYGYRRNARIQCIYDPEFKMGFFTEGSAQVATFEMCPILNDLIQETLTNLSTILRRHPIYSLYEIDIRAPQDDVLVLARCKGHIQGRDMSIMNKIYNDIKISGISFVSSDSHRRDYVLGQRYCSYTIHAGDVQIQMFSGFGGFIQANAYINYAMIEYVMYLAHGSKRLLDLYSGNGNFSLPLSYIAADIVAIDSSTHLIRQGKLSAKKNKIENTRFFCMDTAKAVQTMIKDSMCFDTIVLNPPREGAKNVMNKIARLGASKIIYISCNPTTMARDIAILISHGFRFKSIKAFDMFPQTYHIESIAYFER